MNRQIGEVAQCPAGIGHVEPRRLRQRLAHVQRFNLRQGIGMFVHQVRQAVQQHRAVVRRHGGPARLMKSFLCGGYRRVNVRRISRGHFRQNFARAGITGFKVLAGGGGYKAAADIHGQRLGGQE